MNKTLYLVALACFAMACASNQASNNTAKESQLTGTWKLLSGALIEKGDTTVTDYTKDKSFIKIINDTHFAFMLHDLTKGKDSSASFSAGGGKYTLDKNSYTEHLEYCSARDWEGHDFNFNVEINGDTLIQSGVEKIDSLGVDRMNIERYVRLKN